MVIVLMAIGGYSITLVEIGQNVTILFTLHVIVIYLHLHLDIFAIIFCFNHICNYIAISLQLFWCSSFHVNNI
jgi:hypothetical protein